MFVRAAVLTLLVALSSKADPQVYQRQYGASRLKQYNSSALNATMLERNLNVTRPTPIDAVSGDYEDSPACWLQNFAIGKPNFANTCVNGLERSGALCYKPCPANHTGRGPFCSTGFMKGKFRGFGKPLACNQTTQEREGLLCYDKCPEGYTRHGYLCSENCPPQKPYRCGMLCTENGRDCTKEVLTLSMEGFGVVAGLATLGVSILTVIGTAGIAAAVAGIGIGLGTFGAGTSGMSLASTLVQVPFCYTRANKTAIVKRFESMRDQAAQRMNTTCHRLQSMQNHTMHTNATKILAELADKKKNNTQA
ncbi:hypothetical protein MIR68_008414 [Amoeboaphelidium protococcarum]|nr:hypothetical protein MIR68_008414 [Amoeboaphelidium protococcarum]